MVCNNMGNNILYTLKEIEEKQNYHKNPCKEELGRDEYRYNTIPIILICESNCEYFIGSGVFKDPLTSNFKCFQTPVFRLSRIDEQQGIIILELLQPQDSNGNISYFSCRKGPCKFFSSISVTKFIKTGICIKVNLNCFCGIECLQPVCAKCGIIKGIVDDPHTINVETTEYIAVSDGIKMVYHDSDGIEGFNVIPDSHTLSYSNLFINGMLQPSSFYTIAKGILTLNTQDIPILGTYIILQFIKIKN